MRNHGREFMVGVVFFALLAALGVLTVTLGSDVFESRETVTLRFDNVAGLRKGDDVWLNGLPSGTVRSISVEPDGSVLATARMKQGLEAVVAQGAKVEVKEKSSLGGAVISVETLKGEAARAPDAPKSVEEVQKKTWTARAGGFASVGESAVKELESIAEKKPGFLGKALGMEKTGELVKKVESVADRLDRLTADIEKGEGTVGLLLRDKATRERVNRAIANLESLTEDAKKGEGTLGLLLRDKATADKVKGIVDDLSEVARDAREGKGSLGKLLKDDALYDDAKATVASLKTFSDDLNKADGLLPRLVRDRQMADDFQGLVSDARLSLKDLSAVLGDIKAGKGTVGKLMTDEALYNDLKDAVRSIQRSFEEARENAPILTFAGFLFRTF